MVGFTEEPAAVRSDRIDGDRDFRVIDQPTSDPQAPSPEKFDGDVESVSAAPTSAGPSAKAVGAVTADFLDEHDKKESDGPKVSKVSFFALFKYASAYDYLLMTLAFLGAVGDGSSFSIMLALVGSLINSFGSHAKGTTKQEFDQKVIDASSDSILTDPSLPPESAHTLFVDSYSVERIILCRRWLRCSDSKCELCTAGNFGAHLHCSWCTFLRLFGCVSPLDTELPLTFWPLGLPLAYTYLEAVLRRGKHNTNKKAFVYRGGVCVEDS